MIISNEIEDLSLLLTTESDLYVNQYVEPIYIIKIIVIFLQTTAVTTNDRIRPNMYTDVKLMP